MIHSGAAWENARTHLEIERRGAGPTDEPLEVSGMARLFGNPLKDACGPAVATLIRLMAVTALVIAPLLR
jgi:Na+/H+-translocating membrane pyrophosphatase